MSRPKKKEVKFTKDSVLTILQEVYNEIVEQRNTALRIQNKMMALMKDAEDMQTIGPIIKEQQKIINDCVEKKLSLSKLQSSIWEKSSKETSDFTIEDLDDDLMESLINRDVEKVDNTYKLNKK
jgi:methionine salvage enolase-phosphatase E1